MQVGIHTMAFAILAGQRFCGSNLRSPPPNWCPPLVPLFSHDFGGSAKYPSEKQASQHLILYTLGMDSH